MPQTIIEPGWRALAGFYAIGQEVRGVRAIAYSWSFSDSILLSQGNRAIFEWIADQPTRVDSVRASYPEPPIIPAFICLIIAVLCFTMLNGCSGTAFTTAAMADADTIASTGGAAATGGSSTAATGGEQPTTTTGGAASTGGSVAQTTTVPCAPATLVNWQCGNMSGPTAGAPSGSADDTATSWQCIKTTETVSPSNPTFGGHQGLCNDNGFSAVCFHC